MCRIDIMHSMKGRILALADEGRAYIGRNYDVFSCLQDGTLELVAQIPCPLKRKLLEPSRLLCRFFRHEVRHFSILPDGWKVATNRHGIYYGSPEDVTMKTAVVRGPSPDVKPPMTVTVDSQARLLWGEYWGNPRRRVVNIFMSIDSGRTYEPIFEFPAGEVRHVHNILEDPFENCYWVFVGDYGAEPGIGRMGKDFKTCEWLVKGEQIYRAATGFLFADRIVYATDSQDALNGIYVLDKQSGRTDRLCDIPGSCMNVAQFGPWYAISTSVECFAAHATNKATLWLSSDALVWQKVLEAPKDIWPKKPFQYGKILLPRGGQWSGSRMVFSGQSLKGMDNMVYFAEIVQ